MKQQSPSTSLVLGFFMLFIFISVIRSPVSYTGSDPRASLLLSQVLIEDQSIKLDKYKDENYGYAIHKKNDHYYYYFPIGTSISSIPFVWFETKVLNNDMNNRRHDAFAQKQIAGIVSVLIFLLLYLIAKIYFTSNTSVIISFVYWMGTSLSSTLGQALWSQDFATLYALLSIYLMLKIVKVNKNIFYTLLGLTLFMAYLTRPTMSLLSISVILYLFVNHKKLIAIKTAGIVGLLLGIFILFSLSEFNQLLPDYYMPKRLSSETFWIAFYGNLISPARGILIFSPFLFIFLLNPKRIYQVFKNDKTLLVFVAWIITHLIFISKFPHWWAGWSYGPRFMVDVLPAIFLLFVIFLSDTYKIGSSLEKRLVSLFLIVTISMSIYFNFIQGLYNSYAGKKWNVSPNIDENTKYLFDWKYPQFFFNKQQYKQRITEFNLEQLKPINPKNKIMHNMRTVIYENWSEPELTHRWSLGNTSIIKFILSDTKTLNGILNLYLGTLQKQEIKLIINEHFVAARMVDSWDSKIIFKFDKNLLIDNEINTIKFEFPNASKSDNSDQRIPAMALKSFIIE